MACFSFLSPLLYSGFSYGSTGKESAPNVGGLGLIPGLGRSPGEGKGYPLQYSGLENSMDCYSPLEKEMATHSSILAWKISWTQKPGELKTMGSQTVGHPKESDRTEQLSLSLNINMKFFFKTV